MKNLGALLVAVTMFVNVFSVPVAQADNERVWSGAKGTAALAAGVATAIGATGLWVVGGMQSAMSGSMPFLFPVIIPALYVAGAVGIGWGGYTLYKAIFPAGDNSARAAHTDVGTRITIGTPIANGVGTRH